jgi:hypothetical protein
MDSLQANVWLPETIMLPARFANINPPTNKENKVENNVSRGIHTLHESFVSLFTRSSD